MSRDQVFSIGAQIQDQATPYLERLADTFPGEFNRALRGIGAETRARLLTAIEQGGPRSRRWPALSGLFRGRAKGKPAIRQRRGQPRFYGRMRRAIRYQHNRATMSVRIGWASKSAEKIYRENLARGGRSRITNKSRRMWFASGRPIGKDSVRVPPRPLIGPVWDENRRELMDLLEQRVLRYVRRTAGTTPARVMRMGRFIR